MKNFDIFLIFAQNIDCGYMLELPGQGGFNEYPQSILNKRRNATIGHRGFSSLRVKR